MSERDAKADEATAISRLASEFAVGLDAAALARLQEFVALFARWNRSINLASERSVQELVSRHLVDSFALAGLIGATGTVVQSAVDVGSGGGLPGIPLAVLMPRTALTLFEPNRKKVAFLRTAVRELGLGARVRVEAQAVEVPVPAPWCEAFQLALSRATLAPPSWLALGRELVGSDGQVAVFTAGESAAGLPVEASARAYGEGRRLLLFRK